MGKQQENDRLNEVRRLQGLDFNKSPEFQSIVDLVADLCEKPVALITLLDSDINWIKVRKGLDVEAMPRATSFCQFGIQQDDVLIVPDASKDSRFDDNPLVHDAPFVRFYAGAPLIIKGDIRVGTLCLFDINPGVLTELQQKTLALLSRQVTFLMELELSYQLLYAQLKEIAIRNKSLRRIAQIQSTEIRQPLTSLMGLFNTIREDKYIADKDRLMLLEQATILLDRKLHTVTEIANSYE